MLYVNIWKLKTFSTNCQKTLDNTKNIWYTYTITTKGDKMKANYGDKAVEFKEGREEFAKQVNGKVVNGQVHYEHNGVPYRIVSGSGQFYRTDSGLLAWGVK